MSLTVTGDIKLADEGATAGRFDGDLDVDGTVNALNVRVQGNLEAPFGGMKVVGIAECSFLDASARKQDLPPFPSGIAARFGAGLLVDGTVNAMNVSVQGNLEAPFGGMKVVGIAECGFLDASARQQNLPTFPSGVAARFGAGLLVHGTVNADAIKLLNADCAEEFAVDADGAQPAEPGTVMVLTDDGGVTPSTRAYDKRVAGVVSGAGDYKPGIVLGTGGATGESAAIALVGRVACKVDASQGPVDVGDLLTTSDVPGYAMKADNAARSFGAVIGKALRPIREGQALIPILVTLQ